MRRFIHKYKSISDSHPASALGQVANILNDHLEECREVG
jgi:hypothetical protein